MKILTVVGARPQFIKLSMLSRLIKKEHTIEEVIVHTGQHFDDNMSDIFFREMGLPKPDYNLSISGGSHGEQTGRMLEALEKVILKEQPNMVVVYGDTNSTLAGALAAVKLHIPVAHIEAGLRSFNRKMPEEINRLLTDHSSDILFAPTQNAVDNLKKEGILREKIILSGDIMLDSARYFEKIADKKSSILDQLSLKKGNYILATVHRAENTNQKDRLEAIFNLLQQLNEQFDVVLPLHPRTKKYLAEYNLLDKYKKKLRLVDPMSYLDMIKLEKNAKLIMTDSGGMQKEAYFYHVPCVTLRNETEWVELVTNQYNCLLNIAELTLEESILRIFRFLSDYSPKTDYFYGKGLTAQKIVNYFLSIS